MKKLLIKAPCHDTLPALKQFSQAYPHPRHCREREQRACLLYTSRDLPAMRHYYDTHKALAPRACFSLAALIVLLGQRKSDGTPLISESPEVLACWQDWDENQPQATVCLLYTSC